MKKINAFYVAALFASLLLVSCGKPKPEKVALKFYQAIITNDVSKAKEYCLPSAKEEIERLEKIDVYKNNVNKEPLQLMEVVVKNPNYNEGDTAIVNYKINNFKSFLTLIMKDGDWRIAYSYELRYLTTLEFESTKYFELFDDNPAAFWRKYEGLFFVIKNLAMIKTNWGIPYSKEKNMIYVKNSKSSYSTNGTFVKIFGKGVNYNNELKRSIGGPLVVTFILKDLNDEETSKFKPADVISESDFNNPYKMNDDDSYNVKSIVDFKGRVCEWQNDEVMTYIKFDNCSILHVTSN